MVGTRGFVKLRFVLVCILCLVFKLEKLIKV